MLSEIGQLLWACLFFGILSQYCVQPASYTHNPRPVYSTRKCITSETDSSGPNHLSCELRNVCYQLYDKTWEFFSQKGAKKEDLPDPLLHLGGYRSSPTLSLKVVNRALHLSDAEAHWVAKPAILYQGVSHLFMHWLLDDMFGLFWIKREWKLLDSMDVEIVWVGPRATHIDMVEDFFTANPVKSLDNYKTDASPKAQYVCFKRIVAGPAAFHVGGPGVSQVMKKPYLVREFSNYFLDKAGLVEDGTRMLYNVYPVPAPSQPAITFVFRKEGTGRGILNELELRQNLLARPFRVQFADLGELSYFEQLKLMSETTILISVHGSGLANLVFLPIDTTVIQLFPYKFHRPTYNYIARLANVRMLEWQNNKEENTRFHPEILDNYNLSPEERAVIVATPESTLSKWPANMYWINQDTRVDLAALNELIDKALLQGIHVGMQFPGKPQRKADPLKDEL